MTYDLFLELVLSGVQPLSAGVKLDKAGIACPVLEYKERMRLDGWLTEEGQPSARAKAKRKPLPDDYWDRVDEEYIERKDKKWQES